LNKKQIVEELQRLNEQYQNDFPESAGFITRDYFRENSTIKEAELNKIFGNFESAKKEAFKDRQDELSIINYKKKLIVMQDKVTELEKENNTLLKKQISEEVLIDEYSELLKKIKPQTVNKISEVKIKQANNREALLFLSDWHCGEEVKGEDINYVNTFNIEVMKRRVDRVIKYFLYYCKLYNISKCCIVFGGDLLSGSIHDELARTNEKSDVECMFVLQEYIIQKILEIEINFNSVRCEFVVGNHSRITKNGKPENKTAAKMNWEYILSKNLKMYFDLLQDKSKNKKIIVNVNDSVFKIITVGGRRFLVTHGHMLMGSGSGGFAGLPIYSLAMSSAKMHGIFQQIGVSEEDVFQDIFIGHLHNTYSFTIFNGGKLYGNGCIIGTNEYSLYKIRTVSKIEQTMLVVEDGYVSNELILEGEDRK